jgi:thymidylate synthase
LFLSQLAREPRPFPTLEIIGGDKIDNIDDFKFENFRINGYSPHPKIKMDMAV